MVSIVLGRLLPSCFHIIRFVDSLRINKQMSNLKFVRAMFTSNGMELRDMCQKVLWAEAQIAARVAEAREVNDGLRALFPPQHGRRGAPGIISPNPLGTVLYRRSERGRSWAETRLRLRILGTGERLDLAKRRRKAASQRVMSFAPQCGCANWLGSICGAAR
jgi:hypothetical protein